MSLGSRAINRLRDLYVHVCNRTRRLNAEREAYPQAMHNQAAGALIEQLEPRVMLSVSPIVTQPIDNWAIVDTAELQETTTDETSEVNAIDISMLTYEQNAAGDGIIITGLKSGEGDDPGPDASSAYAGHLILPDTIEGLPVTGIGGFAFYDCVGLTGVTIPDSVTTIGDRAFGCCRSMTNIVVAPDNANFSSVDGVLFNKDQTTLIQCPAGKAGSYTIPDSVASIGAHAFIWCRDLTSVTIPDGVTSIGDYAFAHWTGLTSITIPDSVTSLGDSAFQYSNVLESVTIGDGVTSIGSATFRESAALTSVTIGNSVTSIGDHAFAYCTVLSSATIPDSVTFIGEAAFAYCSGLTSVTIGNGLTSIEPFTYYMCAGLTDVTIGSGVTTIKSDAFKRSLGITSFVVDPNSASFSSVDGVLFNKDQTTLLQCPAAKAGSYTIPDSVTTIGYQAFIYCVDLTSVTIPDSVTTIEGQAFYCCEGLTSVTIPDSVTSIGIDAFASCVSMTSLTLSNSLTTIPSFAFGQCDSLTSVTIPNSVTTIQDRAFYSCNGLTSVTIPDSVTFIGNDAFNSCGLTSITIPDSVTAIEWSAFEGCEDLTSVTIGNSVASIGNEAFRDCIGLTSVAIPGSVTTIGHGAFRDCRGLTSVTMSNGTTSLGVSVFRGCFDLASITIPDSVTTIEESAFAACRGLTSVTIPDSVTTIGNEAFIYCSALTSAIFEGDAPALDSSGVNSVATIENSTLYSSEPLMTVELEVETQSSFGEYVFYGAAAGFTVYYYEGAAGFTTPTWNGYSAVEIGVPPVIESIASYPDVDNVGQTVVVWDVADNVGVDHVDYVCGGLSGTVTGGSVSLLIPEGDFTFTLTAYDAAGNSVSDSYSGTVAAAAEVLRETVDVDMGDGEESVGVVIDEDGDGTPDVLVDPTTAEEFEIVHLTPTGITTTPSPTDPDAAEVVVDVDKTDGWIFINIADPFNGQRELLSIFTADGREINPDNWWIDADGNICMLDDPAVTYELDFQNPASIEGRHVFYNNSSFDGDDVSANAADDAAIDTSKAALLPGETATFANYTSYSRGINGVMIDIANLAGTPSASDFTFAAGNTTDPSGWSAVTAPTITVRTGEGTGGSDRVTLTWADNTIQKQWLQVTVLSDVNGGSLGLEADDVFYFGNAIGETGDQAGDTKVGAADQLATRGNPHNFLNPALVDDVYDFNRDGKVGASDQLIARSNSTNFLSALKVLTAPMAVAQQSMSFSIEPSTVTLAPVTEAAAPALNYESLRIEPVSLLSATGAVAETPSLEATLVPQALEPLSIPWDEATALAQESYGEMIIPTTPDLLSPRFVDAPEVSVDTSLTLLPALSVAEWSA